MGEELAKQIYDPIRKVWVEATPEEKVRQKLLYHLKELRFPQHLIAVEKELIGLPARAEGKGFFPKRRLDILCYTFIKGEIQPLLLIECKATPLSERALWQVIGYNTFVKAPFIAIVNEKKILFSSVHLREEIYPFIPTYQEILGHLGKVK